MSTPSTAAVPPKAPGKKYAGLTRTQWIIGGVAFAAALGYLLWRRHQAASAAAASTAAGTSTSDCTDASGNSIPCSDQAGGAGDLSSLEDELDTLLAGEGAAGGGSGAGTTTAGTTGTTGTTTGTSASPGTATATATGNGGPITVIPSGLHTTMVSKNSAQIQWNPVTPPAGQGPLTGYNVACYDSSGKTVNGPFKVGTTVANIGGLKAGTAYHANVWADPAATGGPHATVSFTTKKT